MCFLSVSLHTFAFHLYSCVSSLRVPLCFWKLVYFLLLLSFSVAVKILWQDLHVRLQAGGLKKKQRRKRALITKRNPDNKKCHVTKEKKPRLRQIQTQNEKHRKREQTLRQGEHSLECRSNIGDCTAKQKNERWKRWVQTQDDNQGHVIPIRLMTDSKYTQAGNVDHNMTKLKPS